MSAEDDITPHLIAVAYHSHKTMQEADVDHEEGHRLYKLWQADVRRLIEFIRDHPKGMDRSFPPGCTNIDAFGDDLNAEKDFASSRKSPDP